MKTTNQILKVYQSYLVYDDIRHGFFLNWSKEMAIRFNISWRVLSTHDGVMNWYHDQWLNHVEKQISIQIGDYIDAGIVTPDELDYWITTYALEMQRFYPFALFDEIKKTLKKEQV